MVPRPLVARIYVMVVSLLSATGGGVDRSDPDLIISARKFMQD